MVHAGLDHPFRFMSLPAEIRNRVYGLLFFGSEEDDDPIQPAHESPIQSAHETPLQSAHRMAPQCGTLSPGSVAEVVRMSYTARRQIHMCEQAIWRGVSEGSPPNLKTIYTSSRRFPLAIFRTNHAIQAESEPIFYGSASFNLMGPPQGALRSWQCISELPRRYRRLIRRVEHFCFESISASIEWPSHRSYKLLDWIMFLKILSNECPALQSLRLWVHSDQQESEWLAGARETDPWIQAILQLRKLENLQHFDMPGIRPVDLQDSRYSPTHSIGPAGNIIPGQHMLAQMNYMNHMSWHYRIHTQYSWLKLGNVFRPTKSEPACAASILPWLRVRLLRTSCPIAPAVSQGESNVPLAAISVPILKLPLAIRARIYRHALLPGNKQVHPYIKSWYDETTRAVVPLLLTCRAVREEAEQVLYGHGVFTAIGEIRTNATGALLHFFKELPPRLRAKIRHVLLDCHDHLGKTDPIRYLEEEMCLQQLTLLLSPMEVQSLNSLPTRRGNRRGHQLWPLTGRIENVQVRARNKGDVDISPEVRKWFEVERREDWLKIENRRQSLRSARTPSKTTVRK